MANLQPGDLVEAAILSFDDSFMPQFPLDYESTSKRCYTIEPGSRWWPVIRRMVPAHCRRTEVVDTSLIPFYSLGLAADMAAPGYVHISRVWLVSRQNC